MWDQHWSGSRLRSNLNLQTRFPSHWYSIWWLCGLEPATTSTVNPAQTQRRGGRMPGGRMEEVTAALSRGLPMSRALWLSSYSATNERKLWVWRIKRTNVSSASSSFLVSLPISLWFPWAGVDRAVRFSKLSLKKKSSWFCVFFA